MTIDFGASLSKTHLDEGSDDPAQARAELEAIIDRLNTKFVGSKIVSGYEESVADLGGDFDAGMSVRCVRAENWVIITATSLLTHTSLSNPSSTTGVIPAQFRPSVNVDNMFTSTTSGIEQVRIDTNGQLDLTYFDWTGTAAANTTTSVAPTIAFLI